VTAEQLFDKYLQWSGGAQNLGASPATLRAAV
jgi:hypothetical protein